MLRNLLHAILLLLYSTAIGQNTPIGQWNVHVPNNNAIDIAISDDLIWGATELSIVTVDVDDYSMTKYTKANGLSDVVMAAIAHDDSTKTIIVGYDNSNIDLIVGRTVTNIPGIKNATIIGDKSINQIHASNGIAYLACGFGIVKIDLVKQEISDTYFVGVGNSNLKINDIWADENSIFAATDEGVLEGQISPFINLSDADNPNAWTRFTVDHSIDPLAKPSFITRFGDKIYVSIKDELYTKTLSDNFWVNIIHDMNWEFKGLNSLNNLLYLSEDEIVGGNTLNSRIGTFDGNNYNYIEDNNQIGRAQNVAIDKNGDLWYADLFRGITLINNGNFSSFAPSGPYKGSSLNMTYFEGSVYVASSDLNPALPGDDNSDFPYGIYISTEQNWDNINEFNAPILQGSKDISDVVVLPVENKLFVVTDESGIYEVDRATGNGLKIETPPNSSNVFRSIAATADVNNNVWFTNAFSTTPIACRKADGNYIYFSDKVGALASRPINDIIVDDNNQVWVSTSNGGVFVYDYNGTLDDQSDDELKLVTTTIGLPSNDSRCLLQDLDGEIWIGTTQGIGVVFCPGSIFNNTCPVDRICIPREDTTNFCDNLLDNEIVNCLAVDPANRKWIGTNGGLFLQSDDGLTTVYNFTEDNSPLLSNVIRCLSVDASTGDVYIGTDKGINTFRAEATFTEDGKDVKPIVYPNPVRPEYNGPIAIRNLANNGNVKIMDVAGHVVYETTSIGGQVVWDGRDVDGERVHTGVYIVVSSSDDGKVKKKTKFVFIN